MNILRLIAIIILGIAIVIDIITMLIFTIPNKKYKLTSKGKDVISGYEILVFPLLVIIAFILLILAA